MKKMIYFISFCLVSMLASAQVITSAKDIPVPPSDVVKKMSTIYKKVSEPTLTARCFGTVNTDGSVKSGSGNFGSHMYNGYYYVYIDSNLLKNSTIIVTTNRTNHQCSYWISESKTFMFVAMHDNSKSFATLIQGEFSFVLFKR